MPDLVVIKKNVPRLGDNGFRRLARETRPHIAGRRFPSASVAPWDDLRWSQLEWDVHEIVDGVRAGARHLYFVGQTRSDSQRESYGIVDMPLLLMGHRLSSAASHVPMPVVEARVRPRGTSK